MTIHVASAGAFTTVQDRGRMGWQRDGLPVGGAMDDVALRIANWLVGNDGGAAVLEATLRGPTLDFAHTTRVAVTGADMDARVDGRPVAAWRTFDVRAGETLRMGVARTGCRSYIAIAGGIDVAPVLGSRSTYVRARIGGIAGRALARGDVLPERWTPAGSEGASDASDRLATRGVDIRHLGLQRADVRLIPGPALVGLDPASRHKLFDAPFTLSPESDRMGLRFIGEPLTLTPAPEPLSTGVAMGTVQLPPDGSPIVLMADRQTTGGYPRLGEIATVDLPMLAQLRPGDRIRFAEVALEEAEQLYLARERELERLRLALQMAR